MEFFYWNHGQIFIGTFCKYKLNNLIKIIYVNIKGYGLWLKLNKEVYKFEYIRLDHWLKVKISLREKDLKSLSLTCFT